MKSFIIAILATVGAWFLLPMFTRSVYHTAFGIGGMAVSFLMLCCVVVFWLSFSSVGGKRSRR